MIRLPRPDALRPANLLLLLALPFLIWLFATSGDYGRSLAAILGVERGSGALLPGFILSLILFAAAIAAALAPRRPAMLLAATSLAAGGLLCLTPLGLPFFASTLANAIDATTSPLVVPGESPRVLTDAAMAMVAGTSRIIGAVLTLANALMFLLLGREATRTFARRATFALNGLGLAWLLLVAHLGFATGLAVAIRAGVTAYILAAILALVWVGLMQLKPGRRTLPVFALLTLAALSLAGWQFLQPRLPYALIGTPDGPIGITAGTPGQIVDAVRYGTYAGAPEEEPKLKTVVKPEDALAQVRSGKLSGAVIPTPVAPPDLIRWQTEVLPDATANLATTALVLGIALALLAACGFIYQRHPLSIAAEFLIDTLRGIPMLVIILYIGLPLAGVLKSSTGGFLDPPNLLRGIVAMAIAYSAYIAEIFRAGINAVPQGQIEAARSLGLTRWQTARQVILPQAFRIVIPPMGNEFIAILKDTSLLSILSIRDLTQRMREFQSATFLTLAPYNTVAIVYVFLTLIAASLVARVEHRFRNHRH
jgi:polar amino acid transport system permease protein